MTYQLVNNFDGILRLPERAWIPNAPGNKDWDMYQEWLAAGNTPDNP